MSLISQLRDEIIDSKSDLPSILRRVKVLASILKNDAIKEWVDSELDGYPEKSKVPDYRRSPAHHLGHFAGPFGRQLKNAPVPIMSIPEAIRDILSELMFYDGVEALKVSANVDEDAMRYGWAPDLIAIAGDTGQFYPSLNLVSAWMVGNRGQIIQVLETVRNRLLNFILELQENFPIVEESEQAIASVPPEQVTSMFHVNIYGSHNVVAGGTGITQSVIQTIQTGDIETLRTYLEEQRGLSSDDVDELEQALEEDGTREESEGFGHKVANWIAKKTLEGAWSASVSNAMTLVTKAVAQYYGWQ